MNRQKMSKNGLESGKYGLKSDTRNKMAIFSERRNHRQSKGCKSATLAALTQLCGSYFK